MGLWDVNAKAVRFVDCPADQMVTIIPGTTPSDENGAGCYVPQLKIEQETVEDEKGGRKMARTVARESEIYTELVSALEVHLLAMLLHDEPRQRKTINSVFDCARCDRYRVVGHPSPSYKAESADSLDDADLGTRFSIDWGISRVRSELNAQHNGMVSICSVPYHLYHSPSIGNLANSFRASLPVHAEAVLALGRPGVLYPCIQSCDSALP